MRRNYLAKSDSCSTTEFVGNALRDYLRSRYSDPSRVFAGLLNTWLVVGWPPIDDQDNDRALRAMVMLLASRQQGELLLRTGSERTHRLDATVEELLSQVTN